MRACPAFNITIPARTFPGLSAWGGAVNSAARPLVHNGLERATVSSAPQFF